MKLTPIWQICASGAEEISLYEFILMHEKRRMVKKSIPNGSYSLSVDDQTSDGFCGDDIGCSDVLPVGGGGEENKKWQAINQTRPIFPPHLPTHPPTHTPYPQTSPQSPDVCAGAFLSRSCLSLLLKPRSLTQSRTQPRLSGEQSSKGSAQRTTRAILGSDAGG